MHVVLDNKSINYNGKRFWEHVEIGDGLTERLKRKIPNWNSAYFYYRHRNSKMSELIICFLFERDIVIKGESYSSNECI